MTLISRLNTLESSGLVRLAQAQPELEYLFRHALVHDAAYQSLVKQDRKQLHRAVGEALERTYPDRLASGELSPLLAQHFDEAGDEERARKYFVLAGDAAFRVYANVEATAHYTRALEFARRALNLHGDQLTHLYTRLGRALELNSQFDRALANYEEMEQVARARGDRPMELAALVLQGQIRCTVNPQFNPEQGEALSEEALKLAREMGDRAAESRILRNLISLYRFTDRPLQARDVGERSLALAREVGVREQLAYTLNDLAHAYALAGEFQRIQALLHEAHGLWRELGNLPMLADSLSTACLYDVIVGNYERAIRLSDEAYTVSRSVDNLWGQSYSRSMVGIVHCERGEMDRAIRVMEECIRLGEPSGFVVAQVAAQADLALVYGQLGAVERGINLARAALAHAEEHLPALRPWVLSSLARLHCLGGNVAEAAIVMRTVSDDIRHPFMGLLVALANGHIALLQCDYARVVDVADVILAGMRQSGVRLYLPDLLHLQAQALLAMGQDEPARAGFLQARAEAEALSSRRMLWQILAALGQIEDRRGNRSEAQSLRLQAREIVEFIAEHCPTDVRVSFLNLPDVRDVIHET